MDLHDALSQISDIRHHVHRSGVFRGYRAMTTAFSGFVAIAAAITQAEVLPQPEMSLNLYLFIWLSAGMICIGAAGLAIVDRCWRSGSTIQCNLAMHAIEHCSTTL